MAWTIEDHGRCESCGTHLTIERDRNGNEIGGTYVEGSKFCEYCNGFSPMERVLSKATDTNPGNARYVIAELRRAGVELVRIKP